MTEENIQAHLNDCSQHSSKFICHECGMVSENFLWYMYFFLFSIQNLFYLFKTKFKKNYLHCFFRSMKTPYPSFPSLSSKRDHEEMEQGDDEVMEGKDKKIKT